MHGPVIVRPVHRRLAAGPGCPRAGGFARWALAAAAAQILPLAACAEDQAQWGRRFTRNMVSAETNLPESFDRATGRNVKWVARLGNEAHGTPVVAGGRVYVGTNNNVPRDPRHRGDRGVLMCLDEKDGRLLWQLVVPKLEGDIYLDWPGGGICSPPTVEGDRVYVLSNRGELMCLDARGMANGNDGPFRDEGRLMARKGEQPLEVADTDADIIWLFDLVSGAGVYPHDSAHGSVLVEGSYLYVNTGNGVDNTHRHIRAPDAPSLVVVDKATGRLAACDAERIGPRIFHCTWASPALGEVNGRRLVFFGGGDGVVYAFEPLPATAGTATLRAPPRLGGAAPASAPSSSIGQAAALKRIWRFDCDPNAPKEDVHQFTSNRRQSPSNIKGTPVFHNGRIYVAAGGDIWWGKNEAHLKCIDAGKTGDVTATAGVWSYPLSRHCCSTPSICDGLVYITDCGRMVHCVDADTGRPYWTHEMKSESWSSTLVADGKVYATSRGGDLWVFAAGRDKKVLAQVDLGGTTSSTPIAANGTLFFTTYTHLYAVAKKQP